MKDLPLVKTSRGHLAVDLLDFDRTSLSDNEFSQPSAEVHEEEQTLVTTPTGRDTGASVAGQHLSPEEIAELQDRYLADGGPDDSSSIPEGWNPDDWNDHLDHLHLLRQDVENWEAEGGPRELL